MIEAGNSQSLEWTADECLYIRLQTELDFAVVSLPTAPYIVRSVAMSFLEFRKFFGAASNRLPASDHGEGRAADGCEHFDNKRDELTGAVLWDIYKLNAMAEQSDDCEMVTASCVITPEILEQYRKIRKAIDLNTYVALAQPKKLPKLWRFLTSVARKQFPKLCTAAATDRTPFGDSDPANGPAATPDAESGDEDETHNIGGEVKPSRSVATKQRVAGASNAEERPGPEDFAQETGRVRCTAYDTQDDHEGERCRRNLPENTPESARSTAECHIHDEAKTVTTKVSVKAAREGSRSKTIDTQGGDKRKTKAESKREATSEEPTEAEEPNMKRNKRDARSNSEDSMDGPTIAVTPYVQKGERKGETVAAAPDDPRFSAKKNEFWTDDEFAQTMQSFNAQIAEKGVIEWATKWNDSRKEALQQVNAHRLADPERYPESEREDAAFRAMLRRKKAIPAQRELGKSLKKRQDGGEEFQDEDLKPAVTFQMSDFQTRRQKKRGYVEEQEEEDG